MRIAIRVDSGTIIGIGHLMRCFTLANELRQRGVNIVFICREHLGNVISYLEDADYQVYRLTMPPMLSVVPDDYSTWIGASEQQDATDTLRLLNQQTYDWMITDHYGLGIVWEKIIRPKMSKILVIDDLANRVHDCDVLLDQNYFGLEMDDRYQSLLPSACIRLMGPKFALLEPRYRLLHEILPPHDGFVHRVLVFFGGTDANNQTYKVLEALNAPDLAHLAVDVVVGKNYSDIDNLVALVSRRPGTTLHQNMPTLSGLMAKADMAIGAGGATTWERMCLGLPTISISLADNQKQCTQLLSAQHLQYLLTAAASASQLEWRQAILQFIKDPNNIQEMSERVKCLVDGFGVNRVVRVLLGEASLQINLRPVKQADKNVMDDWIGIDDKQPLFEKEIKEPATIISCSDSLSYPDCISFIVEDGSGLPLGLVCFETDRKQSVVCMRIYYDAALSVYDLDSMMIRKSLEQWRIISAKKTFDIKNHGVQCGSFIKLHTALTSVAQNVLRITVLTDEQSWMLPSITTLQELWLKNGHLVKVIYQPVEIPSGDVCFILSCSKIIKPEQIIRNSHNLVVHADDLPSGRGWSPMTWRIIDGANDICVTLFEADLTVDSGMIYEKQWIKLVGSELIEDWHIKLAEVTKELCLKWVSLYPESASHCVAQFGEPTYWPRRKPEDSRIDINKSLLEQFNLLRVVDNDHYPAFFEYLQQRYQLRIEKI